MPKSKRNKQIELAKTKKRGLDWKKRLYEEVRSCVDSYENVFVFSVNDMRNSKMKNVREQWKDSRFFIGKNKIMAMALGRFAEEEYKPNLHKIGQEIKGQRGLLFSNRSTEAVLNWFRSYSEGDYARSGNISTEDVKLVTGPVPMFSHSLEPYLRQLGLPTSLVKGVIHLIKDHEVCKTGDTLTPETAKILKLLGYEMAEFHITIECVWSQDGSFLKFTKSLDTDSKENIKKQKKKSSDKKAKTISESLVEDMDVELHKNSDEMEDEDAKNFSENTNVVLTEVLNAFTSTPKVSNEHSKETSKIQENKVEKNESFKEANDVQDNKIEENKASDALQIATAPDVKRRLRSQKNCKNETLKKKSEPKTPDSNTSQDSPIYRQLRNRSVKVIRKRK